MLAEFKYGGIPKETFSPLPFFQSQDQPSKLFYWLKKDFFPFAYWNAFVKVRSRSTLGRVRNEVHGEADLLERRQQGIWFGPRAFLRPIAYMKQ